MASALQKLLRRSQPARIVAALRPSQTPNPIVSPPPTSPIIAAGPEIKQSRSTVIFPSFPFGLFAPKPIFASGVFPAEGESAGSGIEEEDSRTVWADSVKKKRKRKMNKHKYQKLRKRMRKQS